MNTGLESDLQLGADTVGGRDQDRIAIAARFKIEERAEAADTGEDPGDLGFLGDRADAPHEFSAGFDANAGLGVGETFWICHSMWIIFGFVGAYYAARLPSS